MPDDEEFSAQEDLSLLMGDISIIDRSQSEIAGLQSSSFAHFIDFEVQNEVIPEEEYEGEIKDHVDMRVPCDYCGRKFNPRIVVKHIQICKANFEKRYGHLLPLPTRSVKKSTSH